jgi:hypothetical protein
MHERELERRSGMRSPGLASHKLMSWRSLVPHGRSAATLRGPRPHLVDELLVLQPAAVPADQLHPRPVAAHRGVRGVGQPKAGPPPPLGLVASLLGRPRSSGSLDHLTKPGEGWAVGGAARAAQNAGAAEELVITGAAVEPHITSILDKLGLGNHLSITGACSPYSPISPDWHATSG